MNKSFARGFTLIELLAVIAIIGLLATVVSANVVTSRAKARDAKRIADIRTIQLALETYFNDNGQYPVSIYGTGTNYLNATTVYLSPVPMDPLASSGTTCSNSLADGCYAYVAIGTIASSGCDNTSNPVYKYHLGATLERTDNSALSQSANAAAATTNVCTPNSDFAGSSATLNSSGQYCGHGTAGSAKTCYDVTQ